MRICGKCKQKKKLDDFRVLFDKRYDLNYRGNQCRKCRCQYKKDYLKKYPEKKLAYGRKYRKKYREKIRFQKRIQESRRIALKRTTADGTITTKAIEDLFLKQGGRCKKCSCLLKKYHIDHIIPISKGGKHSIKNIQLLCPMCNMKKHDKII